MIITVKFDIPGWLEKIVRLLMQLYVRVGYGRLFKAIVLTQGKFAIVDAEDYERLNKYKWHTMRDRCTWYAVRSVRVGGKQGLMRVFMHREIVKVAENRCVDHINHKGLDNRKANLRAATRSENCCNRRKTWAKTWSRYKGVSWRVRDKRWSATITINGSVKFLGVFGEEISAAKAYDAAAQKYHGRFAVLNFKHQKLPAAQAAEARRSYPRQRQVPAQNRCGPCIYHPDWCYLPCSA